MADPCNDLIECSVCHGSIGPRAEACPQCGTPNKWIHPAIQRFLDQATTVETKRQFTYTHNKSVISGQTGKFHTVFSGLVLALTIFFVGIGSLIFGFFVPFIVGVFGFVLAAGLRRQETFHADLCVPTWQSSNDTFWRPVMNILGVEGKPTD